MKKIISYLGIYLLFGVMIGCYDDDSKTARLPLPDITILGDAWGSGSKRVASVGEECELFCPVDWGTQDSTKFDFEWSYKGEVFSNERMATYIFPETGTTYVEFKVIEKETGLVLGTSLEITVSTKWLLGWLILSEGANQESNLHFIHIDTRELTKDVYKMLWPDAPLGSQPYRLEQKCKTNYDEILVMQRGGDGLIELDGRNFKKVIRTEEEFIGETYPYAGFDLAFFCPAWSSQSYGPEYLVTTKGEVYSRIDKNTALFNTEQYSSLPLNFPGGANITLMTFMKQNNNQFMWDNLNKKWRSTYTGTNNDEIMPDIIKGYDESDPDNADVIDCFAGLPEGIEFVYGETQNEWHSYCHLVSVFKNTNTGKYIFQKAWIDVNTSGKTLTASNIEQYEFPELGINEDSKFCLLRGQNTWAQSVPMLFFNVGEKIYVYAHNYKQVFLFKDCSLGSNAPTGKLVTMHTDPRQRRLGLSFEDGHFYICDFFDEETGDNLLEQIATGLLDPTSVTGIDKIELEHFDGLGKIVHSIFKHGRWSNYSSAEDKYR